MAKRTLDDYQALLNCLYNTTDFNVLKKFNVSDNDELIKKCTLDEIYTAFENESIRTLAIGDVVGVDLEDLDGDNVQLDRYAMEDISFDDVKEIKYAHVLEHIKEEEAYRAIAAVGDVGCEHIVVLKLKYHQIKILFDDEKFGNHRYKLAKFINVLDNGVNSRKNSEDTEE